MVQVVRYSPELRNDWDEFVAQSKNGTFMLYRGYMDYHSHRFEDCSLMFMDKGRVFAVFPANTDRENHCIHSHQGLTYGGLIMGSEVDAVRVLEIFSLMKDFYRRELDAERIIYKAIPHIYWTQPSGEDEYALFRNGAVLKACGISSCVNLKSPIAYEHSRANALKKGLKLQLKVEESDDMHGYWIILNEVLQTRHHKAPVHSAEELELLQGRFPERIKLYVVRGVTGRIIAGTYLYIYDNVLHTQYMTATDEARHCGGLDILIDHIIKHYADSHQFLDFGISTESDGTWLNDGLIYQKEGFGGRGICYNQYEIRIAPTENAEDTENTK